MEESINDEIKTEILKGFLRRMLYYYDPLGLAALGSPEDEYDSDVEKLLSLLNDKLNKDLLATEIYKMYSEESTDLISLLRNSQRMAEDIDYMS